jgi:hypothetical protein
MVSAVNNHTASCPGVSIIISRYYDWLAWWLVQS